MRRRLLGMIGIGTAAVLMLSGFDSAMTCEDLQKNAVEAMKTVEQYSGTFDAGADISATLTQAGENGAQMTLPIEGEMQGSFSMTKEPLAAGIEMQFSGAAAGQQAAGSIYVLASARPYRGEQAVLGQVVAHTQHRGIVCAVQVYARYLVEPYQVDAAVQPAQ